MSTKHFSCLCIIVCCFLLGSVSVWGAFDGQLLRIGDNNEQGVAPYFYGDMDAAGYSDWIWYGSSPIHDHGYHEVLSGEWGAAIYYDGIDTNLTNDPNDANRQQAMWLTKDYVFPSWPTNSDFVFGGTCAAQQNPNNPAPLYDTGKSVVYNDEVEITIDYEVVDMNSIAGGSPRSPMAYIRDPNSSVVSYVPSDQYIFLQTYTIKNLKNATLTGLEFYQFLHSHGANEYSDAVNSTYTNASISDPLALYTPYAYVHQVGNIRYDITQWNERPFGTATHIDFVSFSSTIEPDWVDNDVFKGHSGKPADGTHIHIEERILNDANSIYLEEVGGAMGWSLGSLDPNETVSMTIAFMFAPEQESSLLTLTKTIEDANDCYNPGDEFTYTITWQNLSLTEDAENAVLTDFLPAGLTYPVSYSINPDFSISSSDPNYSVDGYNTYTWNLGTIPANSSGSKTLTVTVNEMAPPGMTVDNEAVLETSLGTVSAFHYTPICCWDDSGVIYVDENATGAESGTDWENAYTNLQDGLARARAACWESTEIRVAQGVYDPGRLGTTTFLIPDNTSVYGGYKGGSVDGNDRNIKKYLTVLAGDTDAVRNDTVVTMGDETRLDGFTVTGASAEGYGVYGNGVNFAIENCTVENNKQFGIYAINGNVTVRWCKVLLNTTDGIYHQGQGYTLTVENSWLLRNGECGILSEISTPTVKNSIVSESDFNDDEFANAGIRIVNPTGQPKLHNLTISNNKAEGIYFEHNVPNYFKEENSDNRIEIQNCIVYFNNADGPQFSQQLQMNLDRVAHYSCIADCNSVNNNTSAAPMFAYTIDPNGVPDPNNYHLHYDDTSCKDKGDPYGIYAGQVDMDGEGVDRVVGAKIDIGADEVRACATSSNDDIYNALDWDADGLVNLKEFSIFQRAWLSRDGEFWDPNLVDPNDFINWNSMCDLNNDHQVTLPDIVKFLDEAPWLWQACWKNSGLYEAMMMFGGDNVAEASSFGISSTIPAASIQTETLQEVLEQQSVQSEPTIEEQILSLKDSIEFLEKLWLEEPDIQQEIDADDWKAFIDAVHQSLLELQVLKTEGIQIE